MKILLSRTDRIGDLILSTPAIASVRASFPGARITMVTSPYNRVVMERNTDVDELVDLPREIRGEAFGARFRNYDIAIALAPRATDIRLVGASKARLRVGYTYVRRWFARLTARLDLNRVMISPADPELCERDPAPDRSARSRSAARTWSRWPVRACAFRRLRLDDHRRGSARRSRIFRAIRSSCILGQRWFTEGSTLESTLRLAGELRDLGAPLVISCAAECETVAPRVRGAGALVVASRCRFTSGRRFSSARAAS